MLQLPRCLVWIYNLDSHDTTLFELDSFKRCNCSRKSNSQKSNLLRKCGLLAHTSPTFLKNCWIKKLLFACGLWLETSFLGIPPESGSARLGHIFQQSILFLGKTISPIRQKGVSPLLLPASMLQLLRCLVWIYNLDSHDTTLFELDSFKKCNCSWKASLRNLICSANVGYSPTPRQHFWKTVAPKNFLFACGL